MVIFSYNLSPKIRGNLASIESLRRQLLLTPIPPRFELQLRWEATINRIYWSLALTENPTNRRGLIKLLTAQNKKHLTAQEKEIVNYKKALAYITQEWTASTSAITVKHIITIDSLAYGAQLTKRSWLSLRQVWEKLLQYLQTGSDHPVIQAGVAQVNLSTLSPVPEDDGRTGRLAGLLFLYKYGYDCRGLLELEEYFRSDVLGYKKAQSTAKTAQNLTLWLEYYTEALKTQLEKMVQKINTGSVQINLPAKYWRLTDRQKDILGLLEQPDQTISNKKVQIRFRVSSITASRDLAKLTSLGLLFSHGKGRSVYYTKV